MTATETIETVRLAKEALENKKGIDIVVLDVRKTSSVTDYYLIASGSSAPHIKALAEEVEVNLKKSGQHPYRKSGTPDSEWMATDYVDTVVHIFSPESRDYYALEKLWNDAPQVTV
ncbi:MAG: ribosome silencing factor [Verrucomicrobiota bacterium]